MKNHIMLTALLAGMLFLTPGCSKDDKGPCDDITCLNDGTCANGFCTCPQWVSGLSCESQQRTRFLGTYSGIQTIDVTGAANITVRFTAYPGAMYGRIMWDDGMYVTLTSTYSFNIPAQDLSGGGKITSGSGTYIGEVLSMDYYVEFLGTNYYYSFSGTK